jgi:hypothetical protein
MTKVQRSRPSSTSGLARPPLAAAVEAPIIGDQPRQSQTPVLPESVTSAVRESQSRPVVPSPVGEPKYLQLLRKEARLRVDQVDALAALRRQIMRRRTSRGAEILTDNTLIRVAVDLLLARADELHGDTEDDLRASLGLHSPNRPERP